MSISTGNLACPSIAVSICPLHPVGRRPSTRLLSAPFVRTSFGARSFSVAAPKIWNSLPPSLRTCTGLDTLPSSRQDPLLPASVLTIVRVYKLYLLTYFAPPSPRATGPYPGQHVPRVCPLLVTAPFLWLQLSLLSLVRRCCWFAAERPPEKR